LPRNCFLMCGFVFISIEDPGLLARVFLFAETVSHPNLKLNLLFDRINIGY